MSDHDDTDIEQLASERIHRAQLYEVSSGGEVTLAKEVDLTVAGIGAQTTGRDDSTQPNDDRYLQTPKDAIPPPLSLEQLSRLSTISGTRKSIIDAISRNTVGLGYSVTLGEGEEIDAAQASSDIRDCTLKLESLAAKDIRLSHPSLTEMLYAVKTDEEECGQGAIEVARDRRTGEISGLFQAPGKRIRRLADRSGYYMMPWTAGDAALGSGFAGTDANQIGGTYFYNFGDKVEYDRKGRPKNRLATSGGPAGARRQWSTNELIVFRLYTSESRDYGLPRDVALTEDYLADKLAQDTNVGFFNSSGVPPTVLFVSGEADKTSGQRITFRVPQQTSDRIANTMKSDGSRGHRIAVIPIPPGTNVEKVDLAKYSDRDMGFVQFRDDNRARALSAFRLSPIFLASEGKDTRYTAEVQRSITLEQVFDPEQRRYERRLHDTILVELGYAHLHLAFTRLAIENDASKRDAAEKLCETQSITQRENRKAHGLGPLPEASQASPSTVDDDNPQGTLEWPAGSGTYWDSQPPSKSEVPFGWNDSLVPIPNLPKGAAQGRVAEGTGTQGLRPGIGGREPSDQRPDAVDQPTPIEKSHDHRGPDHVEQAVEALAEGVRENTADSTRRAVERTAALGDSIGKRIVAELRDNGDTAAALAPSNGHT